MRRKMNDSVVLSAPPTTASFVAPNPIALKFLWPFATARMASASFRVNGRRGIADDGLVELFKGAAGLLRCSRILVDSDVLSAGSLAARDEPVKSRIGSVEDRIGYHGNA